LPQLCQKQIASFLRRFIWSSVACLLVFLRIISNTGQISKKKNFEHKMCFDFLYNFFFSEIFLILRRNEPDMIKNVC